MGDLQAVLLLALNIARPVGGIAAMFVYILFDLPLECTAGMPPTEGCAACEAPRTYLHTWCSTIRRHLRLVLNHYVVHNSL